MLKVRIISPNGSNDKKATALGSLERAHARPRGNDERTTEPRHVSPRRREACRNSQIPQEMMSHADECVRLAGLTDDLIVRDQLLDLAQEWMLTARRARRPSDDTRVVLLHKNLGDNVVPLHTNQDDDDGSPG